MIQRFGLAACLAAALFGAAATAQADERRAQQRRDYQATRAYYAGLIAGTPQLAELTLFTTRLPKGGDIHHHYTGALYVETYLDWVDKQGFCIYRATLRVETKPPAGEPGKDCLTAAAVRADNALYRNVLKRWSDKDFDNHYHEQPAPDQQFFDTFGYFGPAAGYKPNEGLQLLRLRAKAENLQYLETMLGGAPTLDKPAPGEAPPAAVSRLDALAPDAGDAAIDAALGELATYLDQDARTQQKLAAYKSDLAGYAQGIDDADFTLRLQTYTSRNNPPSTVFSGLYTGFAAAQGNPLIVGVNIVGPENGVVAMRDYGLHMRMFRFLKRRWPDTHLSLHAGELALGMVPPEGLQSHIRDAVEIAGAERIGHGIDVVHEADAAGLLQLLKQRNVAIEVNLSSNAFILGIAREAHPLTVYRRHGVPMVISTDDAGVSRNNLSGEYLLFASRYKPSYDALKQVVYASIRHAFLSPADRAEQLRRLDARFVRFEAEIAAMSRRLK